MDPEHEQVVHREYEVESVDYTGPVSFLSLIGGVMDDWYPLAVEATPEHVAFWLQCRKENVRLAMASKFSLLKNGAPITRPFIRIEKRSIGGFSITEQVRPGDVYVLHRTASVIDSRNFPSPHLLADAVALL